MYKAIFLSPMIPSFDMRATASFFSDLFGFTVTLNSETYIILQKDNLTIHILPAGESIGQMEFYLEVDNLAGIWDSIRHKLSGIKFREPFDREYGMREIHIAIPHTKTLLFIGQEAS